MRLDVILHQEIKKNDANEKENLNARHCYNNGSTHTYIMWLEVGQGDKRDSNIGLATLNYLDSIPDVEYIGLADTHDLEDGKFQAVVIFNVTDAAGNKTEHNARVTTNSYGSEILSWEDLYSNVLSDTKQKITDKMEEKGINLDGSLIDA